MASDWECVPQQYTVTKNYLQCLPVYEHPLKIATVTITDNKGTRPSSVGSDTGSGISSRSSSISLLNDSLFSTMDGIDPLSQFARHEQELMDPLSQMPAKYETFYKAKSKKRDKNLAVEEGVQWNTKRLSILNKFTTSEKLSISTSFLNTGNVGASGVDIIKAQTVVADKVKFRLEQLDDFEDSSMSHMMNLSQQEYIQRIEQLNQELIQSWHNEQRVKSLKIAIQCAKMLSDTSVLPFYPSQYVLITDILDIFGKLVYERLKLKAQNGSESTGKISNASARDTCQNWFFKVASIRELLPRLYIELAIIKCYEFLNITSYETILLRLTEMIRGVGDPLVAVYIRCYLVRVGSIVTDHKDYIHQNFKDFLRVYHMIFNGASRFELNRQRIDMAKYLSLYEPPLNFILESMTYKNTLYADDILKEVKTLKNSSPILMAILQTFTPEFITAHSTEILSLLSQCQDEGISKAQLFRAFGLAISNCALLCDERTKFLKETFATINTFTDPTEYLACVETWTTFITRNFLIVEVNRFLGEINKRLSSVISSPTSTTSTSTLLQNTSKICDTYANQLHNILDKILQYQKNIELLLIQENFLPFLDLFQKNSARVEACKLILSTYKSNSLEYTTDAVVINALMFIGKILNNSVNALTVEDEHRQISQLICHFIRKIHFGRDLERQLSFYVEARGIFSNLQCEIYSTLVYATIKLSMNMYNLVNGKHNRQTHGFVKACVAYCYITIPSIKNIRRQMDLYLLSGQTALVNQCLGQGDACFETALNLITNLPRTIEIEHGKIQSLDSYVISFTTNILGILILVPDSPDQGVLYLLRLLLDVVLKYPFTNQASATIAIFLNALDMLYIQSLEEFPFSIPFVTSNDQLYGHDPKFLNEINNLCNFIVDHILNQLKILGAAQQFKTQATFALQLLMRIVRYANLNKPQTYKLAINLWILALRHESYLDVKYMPRVLNDIRNIYDMAKEGEDKRRAEILDAFLKHLQSKTK